MGPGDIVGGKYRLQRRLAGGGMGSVWVARHLELEVEVAVKLIADADPGSEARARFRREAKAAAQLKSPHVVRIFDYGAEGEIPYIAMELLSGEDLKQRLEREGSLPLGVASRIVSQVAKALDEAHAVGLVHRDIKPRNLFLARVRDDESVKVLDFGIAKDLTAREETHTGVMLGSPHYMSPEQARGGRVDARSDVWSLAVVAFELSTGEKPFPGTALGDVIARIVTEPPRRISEIAPELPAALDDVFQRALARDPADRFGTVLSFAEAFAAVAAAHPAAHAPRAPAVSSEPSFARSETTLSQITSQEWVPADAPSSPPSGPSGVLADGDSTLATITTAVGPRRGARFGVVALVAAVAIGTYLVRLDGDPSSARPSLIEPPPTVAPEPPPPAPPTASVHAETIPSAPDHPAPVRAPVAAPGHSSSGPSAAPRPPPRATSTPASPSASAEPEVIRDDMFGVPIGVER